MVDQRLAGRVAERAQGAVENVLVFSELDSTQEMARRLIDQLDEESVAIPATAILARRQRAGTGRGDRGWVSPEGGLYLTLLLRGLELETLARVPMVAAAAAASALADLGLHAVRMKWPNDLLVGGSKLGGLLVHARHGDVRWCAVGLGVNVDGTPALDGHPGGLPPTSVSEHLGPGDLDDRLVALAGGFVRGVAEHLVDPAPAVQLWRELLVHEEGAPIRVRLSSGEVVAGELLEITSGGHLRIRTDAGDREVTGGDVLEG